MEYNNIEKKTHTEKTRQRQQEEEDIFEKWEALGRLAIRKPFQKDILGGCIERQSAQKQNTKKKTEQNKKSMKCLSLQIGSFLPLD